MLLTYLLFLAISGLTGASPSDFSLLPVFTAAETVCAEITVTRNKYKKQLLLKLCYHLQVLGLNVVLQAFQ